MAKTGLDTLILFSNSPGEISRWVRPITESLSSLAPEITVQLYLTPCPYATGKEIEVAKGFLQITEIVSPKESMKRLFSRRFASISKSLSRANAAVLCLGGDPFYARLFAFRSGIPAFAYSEQPLHMGFKKVFLKSEGDLMASALQSIPRGNSPYPTPFCLFMPSSRPQQFKYLAPLYNETVKEIKKRHPEFRAVLQVSPFISESLFKHLEQKQAFSEFTVSRHPSEAIISHADFMVSLPGTNTAEAMYLGTPMMVSVPLNYPKVIVFHGLLGLLTGIPLLGRLFRQLLILAYKVKKPFLSLPNRLFQEKLVPEFIQKFSPQSFADCILKAYHDRENTERQRRSYASLKDQENPAEKIIKTILGYF